MSLRPSSPRVPPTATLLLRPPRQRPSQLLGRRAHAMILCLLPVAPPPFPQLPSLGGENFPSAGFHLRTRMSMEQVRDLEVGRTRSRRVTRSGSLGATTRRISVCQKARLPVFSYLYGFTAISFGIRPHTPYSRDNDIYHQGYFPQSLSHRTDALSQFVYATRSTAYPRACGQILIFHTVPIHRSPRAHHFLRYFVFRSPVDVICTDTSHPPRLHPPPFTENSRLDCHRFEVLYQPRNCTTTCTPLHRITSMTGFSISV